MKTQPTPQTCQKADKKASMNTNTQMTKEEYRLACIELAREQHERYGEVEIDDDAKTSHPELSDVVENGTYVQAWVWVDFSGTKLDQEPDEN